MATVDDTKLADLSSRYLRPILSMTEKSARSVSFLILLSILPALIALPFRTIDDENASFGLQCLETFRETVTDDSPRSEIVEIKWNSPLAVWLTSAVTGKLRFLHFEGTVLISAIATAIFLMMTFHLVKLSMGHRVAFWSLVFLVTHPLVISMAVRPAPLAIGLACSVSCLMMYLRHLKKSRKLLSYDILFAGVAFGCVILSSGLLSVLLLLLIIGLALLTNRTSNGERSIATTRLRTAGVLLLTAFAVSGWWVMKSAIDQGNSFWGDWMSGTFGSDSNPGNQADAIDATFSLSTVWTEFFSLSGAMTGAFLVGMGFVFFRTFFKDKKPDHEKTEIAFLFVWIALATTFWVLSQTFSGPGTWAYSTGSIALTIPMTIFAGFCIGEITERNLGLGWVIVVWELGFLIVFPLDIFGLVDSQIERLVYWSPVIAVAIVLISYCVVRVCRRRFRLASILTVFAILSLPAYNVSSSWKQIRIRNEDSNTLRDFHTTIGMLTDVERILISSEDSIPLPVEYSLRSLWPDAEWVIEHRSRTSISKMQKQTLLVRWIPIESNEEAGLQSLVGFRPVADAELYQQRKLQAYFSGE